MKTTVGRASAFAHEGVMPEERDERERPDDSREVHGNRLTLLPGGPERMDAMLALIAAARVRLDVYFYIVSADAAGLRFREALLAAQARGVAVTLLVDAFGTAMTPAGFFAPLVAAGVRFGRFGKRRSTRYLFRNHQKIVLADGCRVLIGGFNIADSYFADADDRAGWRDFALQVEGPAVAPLEHWFAQLADWTLSERQKFRALRRMVRQWQPGDGPLRWLVGGPTRHLNGWAHHVKRDLQSGRQLDLAAGYFSPGWGMMRRLCGVARRGPACVVLPRRTDNPVTIGASRHLYRRMLEAGIRIGEFRPQKLHSKLLVIDDIAYVGSANFDMRSLFLNVELMLRVRDAAFADALRGEVAALAAQSRPIDRARYRLMASPLRRLRWWFDYLLVGVLDYTVTRRLNFFRRRPD
jgi:cardiolipin synthase